MSHRWHEDHARARAAMSAAEAAAVAAQAARQQAAQLEVQATEAALRASTLTDEAERLATTAANLQAELELATILLPTEWDNAPAGSVLVPLVANNPAHAEEVREVTNLFLSTIHGFAAGVTQVHRVQNAETYFAYQTQKFALLKANSSQVVDLPVWHGTRGNQPELIAKTGFKVFNRGCLWYSANSNYSAHSFHHVPPGGGRQIFLARIAPFPNESNHQGAGIYTVVDEKRTLPTHLVTF